MEMHSEINEATHELLCSSGTDENSNVTASKHGHGSEVWAYFEKVIWEKDGRKMAKCSVSNCTHRPFSCGTGTTKPLWRHLEQAHRTVYIRTEEYKRKKVKVQQPEDGNIEEMLKRVSFLSSIFLSNPITKLPYFSLSFLLLLVTSLLPYKWLIMKNFVI